MLLDRDPARAFMPYPAVPLPNAASGPLAGLAFAVKDLFDIAGYPTSAGSPHWLALSGIKARTAPIVQRLLDSGARFVGKTITDELAFSMTGKNAHFGAPLNGAAPDRITGGSSSGSAAAVSNGLCDFALGTDTGGSVRAPASHCGLYGIRPTHGRVSLAGAHDLAPSYDTCGYFTSDAGAFRRVGEVVLGEDAAAWPERPRLLVAADAFALLDPPAREALGPALRRVEALLGEAEPVAAAPGGFEPLYWAFRRIQGREAWAVDGAFIERYRPPLGAGVAERFAFSQAVTEADAEESWAVRRRFKAGFDALLGADGILVLPTMPDIPPLVADSEEILNDYRNKALNLLSLSGLTGTPQVSLPFATRLGAPLGLSLIGPAGMDLGLVRLAERIARA